MAQILIRNLPEDVKVRLKRRAEARGVSLEAEAREILHRAANEPAPPVELIGEGAGTKLARRLAKIPYDEETRNEFEKHLKDIRRNSRMRTVDFDK